MKLSDLVTEIIDEEKIETDSVNTYIQNNN